MRYDVKPEEKRLKCGIVNSVEIKVDYVGEEYEL